MAFKLEIRPLQSENELVSHWCKCFVASRTVLSPLDSMLICQLVEMQTVIAQECPLVHAKRLAVVNIQQLAKYLRKILKFEAERLAAKAFDPVQARWDP